MSEPEHLTRGNSYTVYDAVAAKDIVRDSMVLYVICPELMPHATLGDLAPGKQDTTVTVTGRAGTPVNTKVTTANYLEATWDGADFTRYPPMIRAGEPVEVFYRKDQDKLSWRSTPHGRMNRTTDRLCLEISASPDNKGASKTDNATYSLEMNSIDQTFNFRSSVANGEACGFRVGMDMKKGTWFSTDNQDENENENSNRVFMDTGAKSGTPVYQVNLKSGISARMVGKDFYLKVPGKAFVDIADRLVVNTPLFVFNPTVAGNVIANVANIGLTAAKDVVFNIGGVFGVNTTSAKFSGMVVTQTIRSTMFLYGAVSTLFKPMSIKNVNLGDPQPGGNSADTDASGPGDKTAISSDSVIACMETISSAFTSIMGKIGVPSGTDSLVNTAKNGILNKLKGQ